MALADTITALFQQGTAASKDEARASFAKLRDELSAGRVRAAEPDPASSTGWRVNIWVKQGILLGFRFGDNAQMNEPTAHMAFFDKDTMPLKRLQVSNGVRIVPGGSSVREGA